MKAVIMAGGRGTRISQVNSEVPKPMIPINGKPVLQYQIETLREQGFCDIVLVIGYLGHMIEAYFGDGARFGVQIEYIREQEPLGTAGALYYLRGKVQEDFLLLCGDLIFDVDLMRFYRAHKAGERLVTLFTHPNSHPYDSAIVVADKDGKVTDWLHKEEPRGWLSNRVNAGLHFISSRLLERFSAPEKKDLDRDVLKPLIASGALYAYDSPEYVKDMGTPDRYHMIADDITSGRVSRRNLVQKQRAVFLDRDGTLNYHIGFLKNAEQLELLEDAAQAVRRINESGYLAIVITNQPVIARGETSLAELERIHNKLETLLGHEGAYLDKIYFCPHHPDRGFAGERPEYKIICDCRKPKAGLLLRAAVDFNIDLQESWLVGDSESDLLCGKNGGCKTALIGDDPRADVCGKNLLDCVQTILEKYGSS